MSYKIEYASELDRKYPSQKKAHHVKWGNIILISFVILGALWLRMNGVPDFLIPGDPNVTRAAAAVMVEQIQAGGSVGNAVTVFCKEILDGAGYETIR